MAHEPLLFTALLVACAPASAPVEMVIPPAVAAAPASTPAEPEPPRLSGKCLSGTALVPGGAPKGGGAQVASLCVDVTEVTAGQYADCVRRGMCTDEEVAGCDRAATYGVSGKGDHPINCVSWKQAFRYCQAAGKRLPTRAEWEWAAHGGPAEHKYPWGSSEPEDNVCWSKGKVRSGPCRAGAFSAGRTPQGLADMMGNLWEWASPERVGGIPNVNPGGSWNNSDPADIRGENRGGFLADFVRNDVVGFRCVRDADR